MEKKPLLLDLFCGQGGASAGYVRAGFDVVGVDIAPQPHYPYTFIQADALTFPFDGFDAVHASPPCQGYSIANNIWSRRHPLLIDAVRARLTQSGIPWVIENVYGARTHLPASLVLCGTQFGLKVYRHRLFESSALLFAPGMPCRHPAKLLPGYLSIYGHGARETQTGNRGNHYRRATVAQARAAMDIDWMTQAGLSEAIPPAYTAWLGTQLLAVVRAGKAA